MQSNGSGEVLKNLAANLKQLRTGASMSQAVLAELSGISRRTIINVEAGDANISLASLDRLAEALGTTFTALVAAPSASHAEINELTWRGQHADSHAVLRGVAPASAEAQLWTWTLGPADRYDAEPDPAGWFEMVLVTAGELLIEFGTSVQLLKAGEHATYSSAQQYSYVNPGEVPVHFARTTVS